MARRFDSNPLTFFIIFADRFLKCKCVVFPRIESIATRYLAVISFDHVLHPLNIYATFTEGFVRATINFYLNSESMHPVHSQKVFAKSSDKVAKTSSYETSIAQYDIEVDLMDNLKSNIKKVTIEFIKNK